VIWVNLADRHGELPVQLDQLGAVEIVELVGQGLVEKVVTGNDGLVAVPARQLPPQADR
jgi:hypothetical protein